MDEMTQLRELRADAPTPDRARLVHGRERLLHSASSRSRLPMTASRKLTVVGAAAAVVVAAVATAQLPDGGDPGPAGPSASQSPHTSPYGDAATVLRRAARAAEAQPGLQPRTGQWVYVKKLDDNTDGPGEQPPLEARTTEKWHEYGELRPNWKSDIRYTYREQCALFLELPADPDRVFPEALDLLPEGVARGRTGADYYGTARFLLNTPAPPPEGLAKVYRALAEVEGMRALDHLVEDATGDKAIALYHDSEDETRDEILFDPRTFRFAGFRTVWIKDQKPPPDHPDLPVFDAGDVVSNEAVVETALVDRDRQRP